MRRRVFRPWRSLEELHEVELLLYNDKSISESFPDDSSTRRDSGIAHVETWRERGPVPHAIISTADLVSATQFHKNHIALGTAAMKTLEIRASYSHAFARFVTGFCDIQQSSTARKTMYEMAKLIDLPESFVTLRHRIVHHQKPPSLKTLELSTMVALGWLREHFWKRTHNYYNKLPLEQKAEEPTKEVAHQIQVVLKHCLKARKNEIRDGKAAEEDESAAAHTTTEDLLLLCQVQAGSLNYAALILVGDDLIFPTQRLEPPNMRGAYEIWDPLLNEMFHRTHQKFAHCIINRLNQILIEFPRIQEVHDTRRRMAVEWLCHLLEPGSSMCRGTFLTEQRDKIMENCFLYPNHWNTQLAVKLIDGAEPHFQRKWRSYLGDATGEVGSVESNLSDEADFNKVGLVTHSLPSEVGGWSLVEPWIPTRIGTRWS